MTTNDTHGLLLRVMTALGLGALPACERGATVRAPEPAAVVAARAAPAGEWLGLDDQAGGVAPDRPRCSGSCPHQACVAVAAAASPEACAPSLASTIYGRAMGLDVNGTARERVRYANACCYAWREAGGRGRPLRADDGVRLAPSAPGAGWLGDVPAAMPVPERAEHRAALGAHWREVAAEEHASVAVFARLVLELTGAGAPPPLVSAALRAAQDEVAHARLAYALAARFDGGTLGPAAIDLRGVGPRGDLGDVAEECLRDGCVGELAGALALRRAAALAADAWLAGALGRMADEEESHALLAFEVLRFALSAGGDGLRGRLARAVDGLAAGASRGPSRVTVPSPLAPYGASGDADLADARDEVLRVVALPALRALLADG
jgi:hypothetical protein